MPLEMRGAPPLWIVDAFADRAFAGNPAGVIVGSDLSEARMQAVASELNLSETAFLRRRSDGDWDLRWFTPAAEVALCGHATVASAHVVWSEDLAPADQPLVFHTASGRIGARRDGALIEIDLPAAPVRAIAPTREVLKALGGLQPDAMAVTEHPTRRERNLLAVLADADAVRDLRIDGVALAQAPEGGLIVTARADDGDSVDAVHRYFAPAVGIEEDPVTGSAACALAPYWTPLLGRATLRLRQLSMRGGELRVTLAGDRVRVAGPAITVVRGTLLA
jgi:PhzF family phenazine biosynthesis protein